MNLSCLSKVIAEYITNETKYDEEKKEIIEYAIETLLLTIFGFILILLVSSFLNALVPAVIAAIFGGVLRKVSGGAHFNSPMKCLTFGAITYSLIGVIANKLLELNISNSILILILFLSLFIVLMFAPVDSDAKPIHSTILKKKLKISSSLVVILAIILVFINNLEIFEISMTLGIFYQTITLLPFFNIRRCKT
ncbi:MAG: accessory regulator [Clostridia bacterium]|jgi:accessory gene regulator B|nr:accessory regulator [Clostridia bacterium]